MRRVVVTGMGIVSPLGLGLEHNWKAITAGKSGLRKIKSFDASDLPSQVAGEVPRKTETEDGPGYLDIGKYIEHKEQKKMDTFIHYGYVAAVDAVEDSGWKPQDYDGQCRTGVLLGSGIGGLINIQDTSIMMQEKGPRRISPFFIPSSLINLISGQVSIRYGFKGPNHAVVTACATGSHAIGDAARLIAWDDADVMVAGGAEAAICRVGVGGFAACRALSTGYNETPERASRPFDKGRDGFVIGEGAGVVVLEEYEHAKKRGAKIYAEVIGYGLSGDAYHVTSPSEDGDGGFRAMKAAMKRAGVGPEQIEYINAHGTSTPLGDDIELTAIRRMFGEHIKKTSISSTKSAIGHLLGAAGAVEAIYSVMAIKDGLLPPTLNLDDPSDVAAGIDLVPHKAKQKSVNVALSNSFGFGGTNACLIFRKV
ncbi:MAG: beta-ketoacyl-[acyl-carrier-protein] synthase II [Alphaproteobacteria bacterium]|nr:MAG: beta-ketoacyl-[acyl-carrier-protein] synthase II [Alphaproteobacteria bacterium]